MTKNDSVDGLAPCAMERDDVVLNIGARLKRARLAGRMRLRDVAEAAGCSESMLSKIERDKARPSLRTLHRLATCLGTSIAQLTAVPEEQEVVVQRVGTRPVTVLRNSTRLEQLIPPSDKRMLEGNIHVVDPGASNGGAIQHAGEEVGYILSGQIELILGEIVYQLGPGDSFFFPSEVPHSYRNIGTETARILWINTPVTF
ncbi:cupin domain-containing protein [Azospirillum canadense]|uniref:cupin domain-containing protein n=1 Tax=Azospirillum canadense TaxID=403962 RepID=UPI0022269291|nr:cupin domain-containing protein [Azospirillum canadense]MCW2241555.1 transcriptional regulator with XRE-family HTH domain [Azospirillum canadense]